MNLKIIKMNTKSLANKIIYDNYFFESGALNEPAAYHDGLYSDLKFLKLFKDEIVFWDLVLFHSTISVKTLYKHFGEKLNRDPQIMHALLKYGSNKWSFFADYSPYEVSRLEEYSIEREKYYK